MKRLLFVFVFLLVFAPKISLAATPPTSHAVKTKITPNGVTATEESIFGRYRITSSMKLKSLKGTDQTVGRGDYLDVLEDTSSCNNEDDPELEETGRSPKEACAWGDLVRVSSEDNEGVDGHCFCTSRTNILAQEKIVFEQEGVTVITIKKSAKPADGQPPEEKPAPYLDKLYAALENNACKKDKIATDATALKRIKSCKTRKKDLCNCSILRCAQFTKKSLVDAGLVSSINDLPGDANSPAIKTGLEKNGFIKCNISEPSDAPNGAVLIYHSHNSSLKGDAGAPYGHIEVKTPKGYVSDFRTPNARTTYGKMTTVTRGGKKVNVFNRYLAAAYVKPPVSCKD
jgi:hypothetical protein